MRSHAGGRDLVSSLLSSVASGHALVARVREVAGQIPDAFCLSPSPFPDLTYFDRKSDFERRVSACPDLAKADDGAKRRYFDQARHFYKYLLLILISR